MTQREQFETWAAARGWSIRRHEGGRNNGAYMDLRTRCAWAGACWRSNEYKPPAYHVLTVPGNPADAEFLEQHRFETTRDCTSCPMQPVIEGCCSANLDYKVRKMSECRREMVTFEVDMSCEDDGCLGRMRPTGMTLASNPAQYPHRCDVCDKHKNFLRCYPYIEHVPKNGQFEE